MYSIYPLKVGDICEPEPRIFYLGDCDKTIDLGNFFFLIQGDGKNILMDTGVTKVDGDWFNPSAVQAPGDDPFVQLEKHGVDLKSIEIIIASHLHWDHISPTVLKMPNAKVYVSKHELDMVTNPPYPWFGQFVYTEVIEQLQKDNRFVFTNDGDEVTPGISIMSTPGHTFGGQSAIVQTNSGKAVITGDVCFTYRNLEQNVPGGFNYNLIECFNSLKRIRETSGIVLPGHDLQMLKMYPDGVK
jgi:glyoxylase-like metal-dependent hydrolase (beta-lactamase superfamily II)